MKREPPTTLIDVGQLLKEPVGSSESHDVSEAIKEEVEGSVEGTAKLTHTNRGVLVQCKLNAEVKLTCSRCLDIFLHPLSFEVEEEFLSIFGLGSSRPSPEGFESFTIDADNILDLSELIRQYVLLNLPMKPLCRPDCPGIKEMDLYGTT